VRSASVIRTFLGKVTVSTPSRLEGILMSKINHERPHLTLKDSLLKAMRNEGTQTFGSIHPDKADYQSPPKDLSDHNLEIDVDKLVAAFVLFHESWTAKKWVRQKKIKNAVIGKEQFRVSNLMDEHLYALALQFRPVVAKFLLDYLGDSSVANEDINLWYNYLVKHLKAKYNVVWLADAHEHLWDFCFEQILDEAPT
jgi:hypothetical protein